VTYDNVTTEPETSRPAFAVDLAGATALIDEIGGPWKGGEVRDGMHDEATGGAIRTITAPTGNGQVFALPGGKVWQVRLILRRNRAAANPRRSGRAAQTGQHARPGDAAQRGGPECDRRRPRLDHAQDSRSDRAACRRIRRLHAHDDTDAL